MYQRTYLNMEFRTGGYRHYSTQSQQPHKSRKSVLPQTRYMCTSTWMETQLYRPMIRSHEHKQKVSKPMASKVYFLLCRKFDYRYHRREHFDSPRSTGPPQATCFEKKHFQDLEKSRNETGIYLVDAD